MTGHLMFEMIHFPAIGPTCGVLALVARAARIRITTA